MFASVDRVQQLLQAGFKNIVAYGSCVEDVPNGVISFDEVLKEKPEGMKDFEIEGNPSEILAVVTFTGGTTGYPKPIQLSHRNVVSVFAYEANGLVHFLISCWLCVDLNLH